MNVAACLLAAHHICRCRPCCHESRITAAICRPLPTPVPSPMKKPQRVPSGFFDSKRCPAYTTASSCTRGREEKREVSAEGWEEGCSAACVLLTCAADRASDAWCCKERVRGGSHVSGCCCLLLLVLWLCMCACLPLGLPRIDVDGLACSRQRLEHWPFSTNSSKEKIMVRS